MFCWLSGWRVVWLTECWLSCYLVGLIGWLVGWLVGLLGWLIAWLMGLVDGIGTFVVQRCGDTDLTYYVAFSSPPTPCNMLCFYPAYTSSRASAQIVYTIFQLRVVDNTTLPAKSQALGHECSPVQGWQNARQACS